MASKEKLGSKELYISSFKRFSSCGHSINALKDEVILFGFGFGELSLNRDRFIVSMVFF